MIVCPSCKKIVEIKRLNTEFWVIKCTNGECDELPEVIAHSKSMVLKMWNCVLYLSKFEPPISRRLCKHHPEVDYKTEWGCPRCLAELREKV